VVNWLITKLLLCAAEGNDTGRTLAIVLGTVGGLIVILIIVMVACYVSRHWPSLTVNRRTRILRAEMAMDSEQVQPASLKIFPRNWYQPSSDRVQLPSAPGQTEIYLTDLNVGYDQPKVVRLGAL